MTNKFDRIFDLEVDVRHGKAQIELARTHEEQAHGTARADRAKRKLYAAIDALTTAERTAYGAYRTRIYTAQVK